MPAGRPKKYNNKNEMQVKVDEYFESCFQECEVKDDEGNVIEVERVQIRPFTITGLCLALDMDRDTLLNYQDEEEFFGTIKKAKMMCHNFAEEKLFTSKNPAGVIFNLKNNYGWKDRNELELSGDKEKPVEINVNIVED